MEERYALLARAGVRHISVYNQLGEEELMDRLQPETDEERPHIPRHLPYIVIVADEMADLMMTAAKEVEQHIIRLAQKSRAVGIHLVLATQKPTVDVITGLIKSNLPARIAFQVASRTDSRVVLDEMGADKLLGNGDMLFLLARHQHACSAARARISATTRSIAWSIASAPTSRSSSTSWCSSNPPTAGDGNDADNFKNRDELYEAAVDVVIREGRGSVSLLQRALGIGYGRAARLIDFMAEDGIVGQYNGSQAREVLITLEQWAVMSGQADPAGAPPATTSPSLSTTTPSAASATAPTVQRPTALSVASVPKIKRNRILPDPDDELDDELDGDDSDQELDEADSERSDGDEQEEVVDDTDNLEDDEADEPIAESDGFDETPNETPLGNRYTA